MKSDKNTMLSTPRPASVDIDEVNVERSRYPARRARRWLSPSMLGVGVMFIFSSVLPLSGCDSGSGETSGAAPPPPKSRKRTGRNVGKSGGKLEFYEKIEQYAVDDEEAERLRHKFTFRDFESDVTGLENRDPFRSYVIRQTTTTGQGDTQGGTGTSDECENKDHVAPSYPLRDLTLVGIVLRGTRSYALFRDSGSYGHIVRKGDCLGQEKARVSAIRTGFVSLQVTPETAPNQPEREPQEKAIQLYPDELLPDTEP